MDKIVYDDDVVKKFLFATIFWGAAAFLVGLLAALELAYWKSNLNLEWLTFGRIRPLHTNAAIFAFGGNIIFAGIYHSTQRLLKTRLYSDILSRIHFWGWQLIIVGALITLPLGYSQSKEYAELEWPLDIAIALVWVIFAVNFFGTIAIRRIKHLYVALWFYIATIITVAVLHIVNSIEIPVSLFKSYPVYAGVQDALVQWWYGHNAVAFFLTTPFLGLMYYYVPKAANRPIYSYKLSVIHFWSLVFLYIWAGPHHLLNSALPDWAQTLGMVFSLMLWAPSWGGMINGLLTLRGAWHLLRTDPIIKFLAVAVTFYGMSTFEGPLLSIKSVNSLAHYTDWIIAHVHGGTLGWNGFLTFGIIYYLVPKVWNNKIYSQRLMNNHFWVGLLGILLYYLSMWASGITQGLMWMAVDGNGQLVYPDFVETVMRIAPLYYIRFIGGVLYIVGFFLLIYNVWMTIKTAPKEEKVASVEVSSLAEKVTIGTGHRKLEALGAIFTVLLFISIAVGSIIEIIPTLSIYKYLPAASKTRPYTPLELAGRDIYIKEGCYVCHSQMVRKLPFDVLRFGQPSTIEESMYDRPFQWGSKRTGPDLARVGGKYPDMWHLRHMIDPREITPNSIMPSYPWLADKKIDYLSLRKKLSVMKRLGVPYDENMVANADIYAGNEAEKIYEGLLGQDPSLTEIKDTEVIAIIAYLQTLGKKTSEQGVSQLKR
ncbi:MAG: cytochrome-c oxidase, cbb3-type subunit I [Deltaproteobacteria bacterium]|nr:cytochrome-c oxidase, cbb3-type subunit I [Deltaproteobacteria bacterium]